MPNAAAVAPCNVRHQQRGEAGAGHARNQNRAMGPDGRQTAAHQKIAHDAAEQHAHTSAEKRNDGDRPGGRDADMMRGFKIVRHPRHVKPRRVVDAAKSQHHAPHGAQPEETKPLPERNAAPACCGPDVFEIGLLSVVQRHVLRSR